MDVAVSLVTTFVASWMFKYLYVGRKDFRLVFARMGSIQNLNWLWLIFRKMNFKIRVIQRLENVQRKCIFYTKNLFSRGVLFVAIITKSF